MGATTATFANNLQRYYLSGVNRQLNDEVYILKEIEKQEVHWTGENCFIHAWTSRNAGVGHSVAATLPNPATAGNEQGSVQLSVPSIRFYGVFQLQGELMAAAPENGGHAFVDWADFEMKGLVYDVKNEMNQTTVAGRFTKGYLNQHQASTLTVASQTATDMLADCSASQVWEYTGEHRFFDTVVAATEGTWIPVNLVRTDTSNSVDEVGAPAANTLNIFVTDHDAVAGTITLRVGGNAASLGFTTATVADGFAIAVVLTNVQAVDEAPIAVCAAPVVGVGAPANQNHGIFDNLSHPTHFGVTRFAADAAALPAVAADGAAPILRCQVRTMATTGDHARESPTIPRLQRMFDILSVESGAYPSSLWVHPFFRSVYVGLGIGTIEMTGQKATNIDVGFNKDGFAFGNVPMRTSRHIPNGMVIYFTKRSWVCVAKGTGKFADADGHILDRVANQDNWQGFWRKYYNLVCKAPNQNMILVGINLNS